MYDLLAICEFKKILQINYTTYAFENDRRHEKWAGPQLQFFHGGGISDFFRHKKNFVEKSRNFLTVIVAYRDDF